MTLAVLGIALMEQEELSFQNSLGIHRSYILNTMKNFKVLLNTVNYCEVLSGAIKTLKDHEAKRILIKIQIPWTSVQSK